MNYCLFAVDKRGRRWHSGGFRYFYSVFVCVKGSGCLFATQANSPSRHLPDQHSTHNTLLHISLTSLVRLSHCQAGMFGTTLTSELLSASCVSLDAEQLSHNWLSKTHKQWSGQTAVKASPFGETIMPQVVHFMFVDKDIFSILQRHHRQTSSKYTSMQPIASITYCKLSICTMIVLSRLNKWHWWKTVFCAVFRGIRPLVPWLFAFKWGRRVVAFGRRFDILDMG
jgi:hypothetical protein